MSELPIASDTPFHPGRNYKMSGVFANSLVGNLSTTSTMVGILTVVASLLGAALKPGLHFETMAIFPEMLLPIGIILTSTGIWFFTTKFFIPDDKLTEKKWIVRIEMANFILQSAVIYLLTKTLLPDSWDNLEPGGFGLEIFTYYNLGVFWCVFTGLFISYIYPKLSAFVVNTYRLKNSENSHAQTVMVAIIGVFALGCGLVIPYVLAGIYGVAMAGIGALAFDSAKWIKLFSGAINKLTDLQMSDKTQTASFQDAKEVNNVFYDIFLFTVTLFTIYGFIIQQNVDSGFKIQTIELVLVVAVILGAVIPFLLFYFFSGFVAKGTEMVETAIVQQFNDIPILKTALGIWQKYDGKKSRKKSEKQAMVDAEGSFDEVAGLDAVTGYIAAKQNLIFICILILSIAGVFFVDKVILSSLIAGILVSTSVFFLFISVRNYYEPPQRNGLINKHTKFQNQSIYQEAILPSINATVLLIVVLLLSLA